MKNKKKISIIGTQGIPARYGGFETLAEQLSLFLRNEFTLTVYCSRHAYSAKERQKKTWDGIHKVFIPLKANGIQSILYDLTCLISSARKSQVVLILGGSGAFAIPLARLFNQDTKFVFHPDGIEWKRKKWNFVARAFLKFSIKTGLRYAHSVIIDNKKLRQYYPTSKDKIYDISYGGDQYVINQSGSKDYWLTMARAEKENNLELIGKVFQSNPEKQWVLLSNCSSTKHGKDLIRKFGTVPNIKLIDASYDKNVISKLLSECSGFIHGHTSGGTNPSLVSAMWTKKPVLCHDNIFNRETTQNKALYFTNESSLENSLNHHHDKNNTNGLYNLAQNKYSWEKICEEYRCLFEKS